MDLYQQYIHASRYARWDYDKRRRETWPETVARYFDFFEDKLDGERARLERAVLDLDVMPSMRALMTAGPALERSNIAVMNCAFTTVDHPRAFDEAMYILMNGTGLGFSVERQFIDRLPPVPETIEPTMSMIVVDDSKEGWAQAFRELLALLWAGFAPYVDTRFVRPAGAPLRTFGGRASGPEPLAELFDFAIKLFKGARGRKLTTIECHDLMCKVAEVVVVGGVRRSALLSLSDLDDEEMRDAKSGEWWVDHPHRALSNNSAVYNGHPGDDALMREWATLRASGSGERGIFNRKAAQDKAGDYETQFGTNPCGEQILRPQGLCNLSEVQCRFVDSLKNMAEKVEIATILGTIQATLTDYRYVRPIWRQNQEEEALLGTSLSGIFDSPLMHKASPNDLARLREHAREVNAVWAKKLGINPARGITTVKPAGTTSQLCNAASGIHPRYNTRYVRTVRGDNKDPLTKFMIEKGFPHEPCVMRPLTTTVFSFPVETPAATDVVTRTDVSALDHLKVWLNYRTNWCDHNPSVTISIKEDEWDSVRDWVSDNFDDVCGLSFLPYFDHVYQQAPYQDCTAEEFKGLKARMPTEIDWKELAAFEAEDMTVGAQTLACTAGGCEI